MKLLSIEPTPSPNSMKLNMDESLPRGVRQTFSKKEAGNAPEPLKSLLAIEGVRSIFRTADFIALDRVSSADWALILAEARTLLHGDDSGAGQATLTENSYGEAHVLVQMYRGIPMQVRVKNGEREARSALPELFTNAVSEAAGSSMIRERKLEEFGVRYGELEEIAADVVRELEAAYTAERLVELIAAAKAQGAAVGDAAAAPARPAPLTADEIAERLESPDWRIRYAALDRLTPEPELLPLLAKALTDDTVSIRRLAVVYLGDLRTDEALPYLFQALRDKSVSVRRTAGDTLSDWGDPAATAPMIESLSDTNKLVRWRAARFLYEVGDESAIPALRIAAQDSEFEIQLQAQIALERIERGEEAAGSVWQQMTAARRQGK
ncbi:PBS lyase HEAT-like repeat-containing protein [Paenibacillus algorifonticola]|uniref:PBS lyase HEAT-like repeat-containing protein n=1 Tax=Paenibacillus algorifonticola TaxID=684063 RepID=A0A1I2E384_9BACL|nr:virulence factor [Paenibacillus algorifonticola]SFE87402.1 PBS lyase HEAT-like repeat-containing protein [Paenibacillus algorifonticola]